QLVTELLTEISDRMIALQGGHRWRQVFIPAPACNGKANKLPRRLRDSGVYLIVGGRGRIGVLLAEYLAETVRAKLVLVGRSPFPERSAWDAWLASHPRNDAVSELILRFRALEARGAELLLLQADVADEVQMATAVSCAELRFQRIDGVIHAAAVAADKSCVPIEDL